MQVLSREPTEIKQAAIEWETILDAVAERLGETTEQKWSGRDVKRKNRWKAKGKSISC